MGAIIMLGTAPARPCDYHVPQATHTEATTCIIFYRRVPVICVRPAALLASPARSKGWKRAPQQGNTEMKQWRLIHQRRFTAIFPTNAPCLSYDFE
jgi:hypothetical protein